ncbi:MAG TPA: tripartite tricarboxylate transporter substrate binding protein [Burkholderiales bacterium]|nr:tripartite tricarboxylate transporter substrate binding protein [Burkholderiales bacterium]
MLSGTAAAEDYPSKPIRVLVGFPPGGAMDLVARLLQPRLAKALGREIVVDNRPGASGVLTAELLAHSAPDGYTLALVNHGALVISPVMTKVPYDPAGDFTPIARVVELQNIFLAKPPLPVRSLKELVAYSKGKPGVLNYATPGAGSAGHLSGELFKAAAGVDWVHVPYKGGAPAMTDFLSGQVELFVAIVSTAVPYVKQGKVHALAVSGARRSAALPDVPTVAESGFSGYESTSWYALMGPARLPPSITKRWEKEMGVVLADPEIRKGLLERGLEPFPSTAQELAEFQRRETAKWAPIVKAAGLQSN